MSETACEKIKRYCLPFTYAFSLSHIKSVVIGLATEYESKFLDLIKNLLDLFFFVFLLFEAPKIVTIHSYSIALTCRFVQLLIFFYAFAYLMWYKRGYQDSDPSIISSVTLKVKGIGSFNNNQTIILDNADFVVPPQENNALFIMTNFIRTDQQRDRCGEGTDIKEAACINDTICKALGPYPPKSNGRWTGKCRLQEGRCEIEGWCPVENDLFMPKPIMDSLNLTIFVKNFIQFTRFGISRTNIFHNSQNINKCRFHPVKDRLCPIFRVGNLLEIVEPDDDERSKMLIYGGVVRIKIDWMCNLDSGEEKCQPKYSFGRLDSRQRDEQFSFGFNFRYASHWKVEGRSHRILTKAFGLRFIVTVNGEAGRFDFLVLTLNIGSMIGVLGLATFICDIVALYFCKQGSIYRKQKFQIINVASTTSISTINKKISFNDENCQIKQTRNKLMSSHLAVGDEC
jgi:P2X purinoceptor 4